MAPAVSNPHPPLALSAKGRRTHEQPISYLMELAIANPTLINFAAGLVDAPSLPVQSTRRIVDQILSDPARGQVALQYDTTQGLRELRHALVSHLAALEQVDPREMNLSADDIIVTNGSQQALYLLAEVLLDEGDIVLAANPSYFVYTGTLSSFGARVAAVPMDDEGLNVDAVERALEGIDRRGELNRVKFIYCTSYYQNPTGLTLSRDRRERLYQIARRFSRDHRILVIEDAAYRELRYEGPELPSIKRFDPDNRYTVLAQTFSKPFAPGIKLGYAAMPPDVRDAVLHHKSCHDFGSPNLSQHIALLALRDGSYASHVQSLRVSYCQKRDLLLDSLDTHMPRRTGITWTRPGGGLYVWLTLPESIDTSRQGRLFQACVGRGVLFVPGVYCFREWPDGRLPRHHIRLSFGQVGIEQIPRGIELLAEAIGEVADA